MAGPPYPSFLSFPIMSAIWLTISFLSSKYLFSDSAYTMTSTTGVWKSTESEVSLHAWLHLESR